MMDINPKDEDLVDNVGDLLHAWTKVVSAHSRVETTLFR